MRYRWIAGIFGLMMSAYTLGSTVSIAEESVMESTQQETAICGKITEINDNTIILEIGERKQQEQTAPDAQNIEEGEPSILELTGETKEITVSDTTEVTRQSMGQMGAGNNMEIPEKPEGGETAEPPEKPEEKSISEMPAENLTVKDLQKGDEIEVIFDDEGNVQSIAILSMDMGGGMGQPGGMANQPESYEAVVTYTEDTEIEGEEFVSEGADENAILLSEDAAVFLNQISVERTSAESTGGDSSSFYGIGAAILGTAGEMYISNSTISTDAAGGAGIFAYGDGTVYAADSNIKTAQDTSGGIHAAGGGTLYAWDLNIETNGESSAAIRSDRGGGTMVVDGGTYTSNGTGSPAVYCTADIAVTDADLTANGSEAICIEGLNTLHLYDCNITGNMQDLNQNDCTWNVIVYQSMSGDSEIGNSTLELNGGTLTAQNGGMFYTTNTECTITLSDVAITYADENDFFLRCSGNANERGWGTTGANGSDCLFTAYNQEMQGDVIWDSISDLDFYVADGSILKGAVIEDETYAGEGGDGYCNLFIDETSQWIVTGNSIVTNLDCAGTVVDEEGNTVTIQGTDGTVYVEGDSMYTVSVESYQTIGDLSGASSQSSWEEYEITRPEEL